MYDFEKSDNFGVAKVTFIRKKNKKSGDIWSLMQTKFAKKGRRWYLRPKNKDFIKKIVEHLVRKKGYRPVTLRKMRIILLKNRTN